MLDVFDAGIDGQQVGHVAPSEEERHVVFTWRMVAYSQIS